jgi:hypothetical protein
LDFVSTIPAVVDDSVNADERSEPVEKHTDESEKSSMPSTYVFK